ncbi:MAG: DUF1641 domain-containing protein [Desulfobulbaceae bacterium]|nr:MAG: DUF1641 domain-containing protein [Desulfobulbaceae bacterium]
MNEALILEKLDQLSAEVQSLKSDVLQELKTDFEPLLKQAQPHMVDFLTDIEGEYTNEKAVHLAKNVLRNLDELNEMVDVVKMGTELKNDLVPIAMQAYPAAINFFNELEGDFHIDEITVLLRKVLTNLENLGEAVDMLKAGVELRDDLVPILQLVFPKVLRFMNSLHEGEFQAEQLGDLLHTILINIHTLSDLLNMAQPLTELVKELTVVMQGTDVINSINIWLDSLQQSSGVVKLAGTAWAQVKRLDYNDQQVEEICQAITNLDLTRIEPVGPVSMVRQLRDPKVQTALGFLFTMLNTMGTVLVAYQDQKKNND